MVEKGAPFLVSNGFSEADRLVIKLLPLNEQQVVGASSRSARPSATCKPTSTSGGPSARTASSSHNSDRSARVASGRESLGPR